MTQLPEQGAVGGEIAPELTPEERLNAAFEDAIEEPQDEEPAEPTDEVEEEADDDTELEAEADDLPPIEAPVSWDAEAKAVFATLPREAQEIVQKREADRERFVQQKSQEAARAKQEIEQSAYQQLAQYERSVSEQLAQYAQQIMPQRPDPAMLQYDPAGFYAKQAEYEGAAAQQRELQQQAHQYAEQAQQREAIARQQEMAREHQLIVETFPEYLDPTNGPALRQQLSSVARELGYPNELIEQARASDILAMKVAAEWRADSLKLKALNAKKMEKVRAAKSLPKQATPGQKQAPGAQQQARYASDREAMKHGDRDAELRVLDSFFVKPK
jgi:hypothetical protein